MGTFKVQYAGQGLIVSKHAHRAVKIVPPALAVVRAAQDGGLRLRLSALRATRHAESAAPNKMQFNGAGGLRAYIDSRRIGDQCHVGRIFDPSCNGSNERSGDAPGKQRIREAGRCTLKEKANALGCL
jgi:hypothetical protein